jgi:hypothetical protein
MDVYLLEKLDEVTIFENEEDKLLYKSNLKELSKLLDYNNDYHKYLKGEILRNKGKFKKAEKWLKRITDREYLFWAEQGIIQC